MEEKNLIPENEEEAAAGHHDIALVFEQTILLIGQAFNSLAYQRRLNILSTLIDNNTRVKEILKEQTLEIDSIDNTYLFGDKFEERLSKVSTAKQKPKSLFTGLHWQKKQDSMDRQPFRQIPLPQHQQMGTGQRLLFAKAANRRSKSLFEKSEFSTAELRGAKSSFISQDISHYQKLDNTEGFSQ